MNFLNNKDAELYLLKEQYTYMKTYDKATKNHRLLVKTDEDNKILCLEYNRFGVFNKMYISHAGENAMKALVSGYIEAAFEAQQFDYIVYHDGINSFKIMR